MQTLDLCEPNTPSPISVEYTTMKQQFYLGAPKGMPARSFHKADIADTLELGFVGQRLL
jgi:hypothetical protein